LERRKLHRQSPANTCSTRQSKKAAEIRENLKDEEEHAFDLEDPMRSRPKSKRKIAWGGCKLRKFLETERKEARGEKNQEPKGGNLSI